MAEGSDIAQKLLSAVAVRKAKHPGGTEYAHRISDGGGLYLQITNKHGKSWLMRYQRHGVPVLLGLGRYGEDDGVSLAEARTAAEHARAALACGDDPRELKQAKLQAEWAKAKETADHSFKAVATALIRVRSPEFKSAKHAAQWTATLEKHVYPAIGRMNVAKIETADVRRCLDPIWTKTPETAQRIRGRIEAVLDFAKAHAMRAGENPARWRGHLSVMLTAPTKAGKPRGHHAALPWAEVPAFMSALEAAPGMAAEALAFLILTASRTSEVLGATWQEIDLPAKVWTVPGRRMKSGRDHRVALSGAAIAVLMKQKPLAGGNPAAIVFPGMDGKKALSNMALLALLRRVNLADDAGAFRWTDKVSGTAITAHGFRSSFRDWAGEATDFPTEVAEIALAHATSDKTVKAYARGDLFEKRAVMMEAWATYITGS